MKNFDQAIDDFNLVIKMDPKSAFAYCKRGESHASKDNMDLAISDFDKAIELNPKYAEAYVDRGMCQLRKRNFANALGDFSMTVDLDPTMEPTLRDGITKLSESIRETSKNSVRFLSFTPDETLQREIVGRSKPEIVPKGVERSWAEEHTISRSVSMTSQDGDAEWRGLVRAWWVEVERGCQFVESRLNENHGNDPRTIRREAKFVGDGTTAVNRVEVVYYRTGKIKIEVNKKMYTVPVRYESDFGYEAQRIDEKK